jgi:YVTN family beta-propeller protein
MTIGNPAAGTEVAGYRIEHLLGRGGMGTVYRAHDARLDRPVALKLLAPGASGSDGAPERLLRESHMAARLDHPNVIPIYEAGQEDGRLFIAMRYIAGGDLKALLRSEGSLPPPRAVAVAAQIADALDAAHRRGLVHRDVKPSNVLLDSDDGREHCYLADFGLTQSSTDRGPADGQGMGTIDYVAPEQIRGEPLDGRADQYALACLLFECLTGSVPYRARSDVAAIFAHLEEPAPRASERAADLAAAIDAVLARGMAKRQEERYGSCSELVAEAGAALGLVPAPPRTRLAVLAAVVAATLAAALVAVVLLRSDAPPAPAPTGSLTRVDARTNEVTGRTPVAGHPGNLAVTPGGIWMADYTDGVLWRYEPGAGRPQRMTSNGEPRDLAALNGNVYVAADRAFLAGVVSRYDASTGVRQETKDLLACAVSSGEGVLWVAGCPNVQRLTTGEGPLRELAKAFIPYRSPATVENTRIQIRELAIGAGSLWVLGDALDRRMWQLDARTGDFQRTIELRFPPTSAAVAGGAVWITDGLDDRVVPVDVATGRALPAVSVGRGASGIVAGAGAVWVANTLDGTVSRIDPATRRVVATIRVGGLPRGVAVGDETVWVTAHGL